MKLLRIGEEVILGIDKLDQQKKSNFSL